MHRTRLAAIAVTATALVAVSVTPANAGITEIAALNGPLGFAIGKDGTFYVAQSFDGVLTRVLPNGKRTDVVQAAEGSFISGVDARWRGDVAYTVSLPPELSDPDGPPTDTTVNRLLLDRKNITLASMQSYEEANNPDGSNNYGFVGASEDCLEEIALIDDVPQPQPYPGEVFSNPYAVAFDALGGLVVADAGANALIKVSATGKRLRTVAVLPPVPQVIPQEVAAGVGAPDCSGETYFSEPVPTDVEIGPGGHYYVSALPGGPELGGAGTVFKVNRWNGVVTQIATGLIGATDLAVAKDGTIYVADLFGFSVAEIAPGASEVTDSTFVECPSAVEIDRKGTVWVAEAGICGDDGEFVPGKIRRL